MLEFICHDELKKFIQRDNFKSYFDEYRQNFLDEDRAKWIAKEQNRSRDTDLRRVTNRIIESQRANCFKYSTKRSRKRDWDVTNHKVLFFYDVKNENSI